MSNNHSPAGKSKAIALGDQASSKNSEKITQEEKRMAGLFDVTMMSKFVYLLSPRTHF
jgi:hypothetical protein